MAGREEEKKSDVLVNEHWGFHVGPRFSEHSHLEYRCAQQETTVKRALIHCDELTCGAKKEGGEGGDRRTRKKKETKKERRKKERKEKGKKERRRK